MATQSQPGKSLALTVALAIVGFALGGLVMWLVQSATVSDLRTQLATAEQRIDELSKEPSSSCEPTSTEEPDGGAGSTQANVDTFATAVRVADGVTYVTLDYIQFLTGDEAAAAAAAHGDESPPPNDYYIVNDNPQLREFPVQAGISAQVVFTEDGMSVVQGQDIPLNDWVTRATGPNSYLYLNSYYIVTVTNGVVTALDQQYLP